MKCIKGKPLFNKKMDYDDTMFIRCLPLAALLFTTVFTIVMIPAVLANFSILELIALVIVWGALSYLVALLLFLIKWGGVLAHIENKHHLYKTCKYSQRGKCYWYVATPFVWVKTEWTRSDAETLQDLLDYKIILIEKEKEEEYSKEGLA